VDDIGLRVVFEIPTVGKPQAEGARDIGRPAAATSLNRAKLRRNSSAA
jgi:hypothetical protein